MGSDTEEIKKDCGCIIIKWDDDWGRCGQYVKQYCDKCQTEKKNYNANYIKKYDELTAKYKINSTNELFEEIIKLQENKLKDDINERCCTFNAHKIYCPCCDKMMQYNNFERHIKSLGHIKKLPVKNKELEQKATKINEGKQKCIKANKLIKLCRSGEITKEELNIKMKELGINIKFK